MGEEGLSPQTREWISRSDRLYVACSGGADSVFLTLLLARRLSSLQSSAALTVLHFNHKLRGEDSDGDERFVSELCSGLGLPFVSESWQRKTDVTEVSEEAAREARMAFFARALGREKEGAMILTGHHADDVAETLLMRLSRGSGLQGLCAPRSSSIGAHGLRFGRPLLGLRKQWIVERLREAGAPWREDASNLGDHYYRNRLRQRVIPEWAAAADRDPMVGAARSRVLLEEDWEALEGLFDAAWEAALREDGSLRWEALLAMPRAFRRRALVRLVAERSSAVLAASALEDVLQAVESGTDFKLSLEKACWLSGGAKQGSVALAWEELPFSWGKMALPVGSWVCLPGAGSLQARWVTLDPELRRSIRSGAISHEESVFLGFPRKQSVSLWVKPWSPGDSYYPLGREGSVKLKELFMDRKIPRALRRKLPIVLNNEGEIMWVPGLPPSRNNLVAGDTTSALQLTYVK